MKCVKNVRRGKIFRVKDDEARILVRSQVFVYCSKEEWKTQGRPYARP
jgi:hypothetical protein